MTEAEWLACPNPIPMLESAQAAMSGRKLRLFACACCRHVWEFMTDPRSRAAVELVEMHAGPGPKGKRGLPALRQGAWGAVLDASNLKFNSAGSRAKFNLAHAREDAARAAWGLVIADMESVRRHAADAARWGRQPIRPSADPAPGPELAEQAALLREIAGSGVVRPVGFNPTWRSADAVGLARGIYDERAFDRLPLLADALMDAGCHSPEILAHCRSEGPHVRGCWVVDLVLGKE